MITESGIALRKLGMVSKPIFGFVLVVLRITSGSLEDHLRRWGSNQVNTLFVRSKHLPIVLTQNKINQ